VDGIRTCWAVYGTEDRAEISGAMVGVEISGAMDASCREIWARIAADCSWK
jgi:hypothetical protein